MEIKAINRPKIPIGLKIVAIYLILIGIVGLVWPILGLGPHHPEFEAQSMAYKFGKYSRSFLFDFLFVVSGIGILRRKVFARKLGLTLLIIELFYSTGEFAWGFASGKPSLKIFLISFCFVGLWNAIWFYLLLKKSSAEALINNSNTQVT